MEMWFSDTLTYKNTQTVLIYYSQAPSANVSHVPQQQQQQKSQKTYYWVLHMHVAGKSYRIISRSLDICQSTIPIVYKRFGTGATLYWSKHRKRVTDKEFIEAG